MMDDPMLGRGLEDAIEIQRQFNELDRLMQRQIRLSGSEDPFERIRQITEAQAEFRKRVDALLTAKEPE